VALKGDQVLAWAEYHPRGERADFGPILVVERIRRQGIGSALLPEAMVRSRQADAKAMIAGWVNLPIYVANGFSICRRYAIFEKALTAP